MKNYLEKIYLLAFAVFVSAFFGSVFAEVWQSDFVGIVTFLFLLALNVFCILRSSVTYKGRQRHGYALNTLGTIASGVGVPTSLNGIKGVHGALVFEISTTPQQITLNINGRITTVLLDTAGINNLCNPRTNGRPATSFYLPIANGLQTEFTFDLTIVNNVATAFDVYGISTSASPVDAPGFYVSSRQTVNAGAIQVFDDFTYLALPNAVAADQITILGSKRNSQGQRVQGNWTSRCELQGARALIAQRENAVSGLVPAKVAFDNYTRDYEQINFQPNATQIVYVQRLVGADFRGLEVFQ